MIVDVIYTRKSCIFPKQCGETGAKIPWFSTAYIRQRVCDQMGLIDQRADWISDEAYLFLKLKGDA